MAADYDLQDRLIEFAVRVIRLVEAMPRSRVANHVGGQLLRRDITCGELR